MITTWLIGWLVLAVGMMAHYKSKNQSIDNSASTYDGYDSVYILFFSAFWPVTVPCFIGWKLLDWTSSALAVQLKRIRNP